MDSKNTGEVPIINEQDDHVLAQVMHNIILATYQLRLYDTENPAFLQSVDTITGFTDMLAGKFGQVTLAITNSKLVMNGRSLSPKKEEKIWEDNFVGLMKKSELVNIVFLPGVTGDEVKLILKGITRKKGLALLKKELLELKTGCLKLNDTGSTAPKAPVSAVETKEPGRPPAEEKARETELPKTQAPVAAAELKIETPLPSPIKKEEVAPAPAAEKQFFEAVKVPEEKPDTAVKQTAVPPLSKLFNTETANEYMKNFERISVLGDKKQIKEMLGNMLASFNSDEKAVHMLAAATIKAAFKYFRDNGNREITRYLSGELKIVLEKENDGPAYRNLASCIADEINQEILEGDYSRAASLLGIFILHEKEDRLDAKFFLDNLLEKENIELLFRDLFSEKQVIRDHAFEILTKMKERLYARFLRHLSSTDNLRTRRILTDIIKHMENNAVPELIDSLDDKMAIFELIRIIEILDAFTDQPTVYIKLEKLLTHFDFKVRKEALIVLSRFGNEKALKLMTKSLSDNNPLIRQEAVRLLGNAEYKGAFPGLKAIAAPKLQFTKEEDEAVQIEATIALGKIKHPEALALLKGILFTHFWLKPKSDRIRGAAIQAISLIGGQESTKLLNKAKRDFSKFVRTAAAAAMTKKISPKS